MEKKLNKLKKVNESLTIYRYDNGWMFEATGTDFNDSYNTAKILCNTEEELISLLKEHNTMEKDN